MAMTQHQFDDQLAAKRRTPEYQAAFAAAQLAFEIGGAVRQARRQRGWTQAELARHAGMKQHAISRLEAGDVVPTLTTLERIAQALETRVHVGFAA